MTITKRLDFTVYYTQVREQRAEQDSCVEAYCPEFDLAAEGRAAPQALNGLLNRVQDHLSHLKESGNLWETLMQAGYRIEWDGTWHAPRRVVADLPRVGTEIG